MSGGGSHLGGEAGNGGGGLQSASHGAAAFGETETSVGKLRLLMAACKRGMGCTTPERSTPGAG